MRIKSAGDTAFRANIRGNVNKLIKISLDAGIPYNKITRMLGEINRACPGNKDSVYLYFRKHEPGFLFAKPFIRSGIKIVRNGKITEVNVDPNNVPKDKILSKFIDSVKKLIKGQIEPEEVAKDYTVTKKSGWLYEYKDLDEVRQAY